MIDLKKRRLTKQQIIEKQDKISNYKTIIILLLILIIILLLVKQCKDKKLLPTDNVDIYEINCDCDESIIDSDKNFNIEDIDENLIVFDKDKVWNTTQELHIFTNPKHQMEELIAPGATNSYVFVIKNIKDCLLSYYVDFEEDNEYGINMNYKLRVNGKYVIDEWSSFEELKTKTKLLKANSEDEFILDWKWIHDDKKDTEIGSNINSKYALNITIYAEQVA